MLKHQDNIAFGLDNLIATTRAYADSFPSKLTAMQSIYLEKNQESYSGEHQRQLDYYLRAFSYKFYLAALHLEQLWAITHGRGIDITLYRVLLVACDTHDTSNDEKLLSAFLIEDSIIQSAAFYDFFGLYIWSFFDLDFPKGFHFTERKLVRELKEIRNQDLQNKAANVLEYYGRKEEKIYRELIKKLRNSMVHRDEDKPSFEEGDTLAEKLLQGFPSYIAITTCSRLFQDIQNDMFYLVTDLISRLYDLEWKPGSYQPGMYT